MSGVQQYNVTLPPDLALAVERKVRDGSYASVNEVLSESVRALIERDAAVEGWLRDEVLPGHAEYLADPSSAVTSDALLSRMKARRADPPR